MILMFLLVDVKAGGATVISWGLEWYLAKKRLM